MYINFKYILKIYMIQLFLIEKYMIRMKYKIRKKRASNKHTWLHSPTQKENSYTA